MIRWLAPLLLTVSPALADEAFVEANILGIFYHELGHAVIDIEGVPIFAQEEDAADVFSIFLIDALFDDETATALAYDASVGFWYEAETRGADVPWWDVHGPDEQRFYNTVCLFYGADPDGRADFAEAFDLPEERADYCPDEFDQANAAWGAVLDDMAARGAGETLDLTEAEPGLISDILTEETAALNAEMSLADVLEVRVEPCGEANAFYDPNMRAIIFCTEFEAHLWDLAARR